MKGGSGSGCKSKSEQNDFHECCWVGPKSVHPVLADSCEPGLLVGIHRLERLDSTRLPVTKKAID